MKLSLQLSLYYTLLIQFIALMYLQFGHIMDHFPLIPPPVLSNTQLRLLLVRTVTTSRLIALIISATFLKHPLVLSINLI